MEVEDNRQCLLMSANSIVVQALYQNTIWGPSESYAATIAFGPNKIIVMKKSARHSITGINLCLLPLIVIVN
jgi:hypothetical protein